MSIMKQCRPMRTNLAPAWPWRWSLTAILFICSYQPGAHAQCFGTFQFPSATIVPDDTGVPTTISTASFAGDRATISLIATRTYRFTSSGATDHITISTTATSGALVFGTQPVFFTATTTQNHFVHFHTNSSCGTQNSSRTTTVTRTYCAAGSNNCGGSDETILRVSIGAINNTSGGCNGNGYSDFSALVTGVFTGQAVPITVLNSNAFVGDQVRVFVDWDRNFSLSDPGEEFTLSTTDNLTFTGNITAPPGTAPGNVRMRVRLTFTGAVLPCGTTTFGEVEDYTLNVGTFGNGVHAGGSGRGDVMASITPAPIASNIYSGGVGRGDVTAAITPVPIASSIYSGGIGRGDIQARIIVGLNDLCILPDTVAVQPFGACTPTTGTTAEATQDGGTPNCDSNGAWPDVWYLVNSGPNSTLLVTVQKVTAQDIVLQVLSGACPGTSIACGIAGSGPFTLTVPVTPFTDFRIRVSTNTDFGLPGSFTLCVTGPAPARLALRAFLEGPYQPASGSMSDALRTLPGFPTQEPYSALGYTHTGGGNETVAPAVLAITGPDAIVDWVVVELRSANTPGTVLATRSALIQRDGDVVDTDGSSPISFPLPADAYHVALRHRNHLGVMTFAPVTFSATPLTLDLTQAGTPTFGANARKSIPGAFPAEVLWAGDVTFNGQVKYTGSGNDRDPILQSIGGVTPTNTVSGYQQADVNMNGQVKYTGAGNDRDPILQNIGGVVPTNIRNQQLP